MILKRNPKNDDGKYRVFCFSSSRKLQVSTLKCQPHLNNRAIRMKTKAPIPVRVVLWFIFSVTRAPVTRPLTHTQKRSGSLFRYTS